MLALKAGNRYGGVIRALWIKTIQSVACIVIGLAAFMSDHAHFR
jgi:hypothetical protein